MNIKFVNLDQQYREYKGEIDAAIQNVIDSASFIAGEEIAVLERKLSEYTGAQYVISCSSGTDALLLSLKALNVKAGSEVITSPFTFFATAEVIAFLGAKPVFVDCEEETYNINTTRIEEKINERTKAIIPVSLYGQPADMDEINEIAGKYNIPVIEDGAQSFGSEYQGRKSCNLSTIGCTSFFPSKPLGCYGDGGAIFTNDEVIALELRSLSNHGQTERYVHKHIGINGRLDTIQAAILGIKLKYFPEEVLRRQQIAVRYSALLHDKDVIVPFVKEDRTSVFAQYSIRVKNREETIARMSKAGVPTAVHYPIPLYRQSAFLYLGESPGKYPVTEKVSKEIMSLPMSAFLTQEEQDYIVGTI